MNVPVSIWLKPGNGEDLKIKMIVILKFNHVQMNASWSMRSLILGLMLNWVTKGKYFFIITSNVLIIVLDRFIFAQIKIT